MTHSFRLSIYLDFTDSTDFYRKIHLFFCSSKNENWFHANSEFVDNWVASEIRRIKQFIITFQKKIKKSYLFFKTHFNVICQIMVREGLQLTSWNLASDKYTDERFWLTGKIWLFRSFHGNMNDYNEPHDLSNQKNPSVSSWDSWVKVSYLSWIPSSLQHSLFH